MKLILLAILSISMTSFSQTYSFSELVIRADVETSSGTEQRIIETKQGTFRFKFEKSNIDNKTLFTILEPGMNYNPNFYSLVEDVGYVENSGTLFQKSHYYSTEHDKGVFVLVARDKSIIVIFKPDKTIEEYLK